jgi:hypothetical protein
MTEFNFMSIGVIACGAIGLFVLALTAEQISNASFVIIIGLALVGVIAWGVLIGVGTSTRPAVEREK